MSSLVDSLSTANRMVKAAKKLNRGSVQTTAILYCCKISCHYSSIFQPRQKQCQRCFISSEFYFSTVFTSFGVEIDPFSALPLTRLTPLTRDRTISWHRSTIKLPKWHYTSIELPNRRMHWADSAWDTQGVRMPGHCGGYKDTVSSFFMWILAHYLFGLQGVNMVGIFPQSHHRHLGFSSSRFWKLFGKYGPIGILEWKSFMSHAHFSVHIVWVLWFEIAPLKIWRNPSLW